MEYQDKLATLGAMKKRKTYEEHKIINAPFPRGDRIVEQPLMEEALLHRHEKQKIYNAIS